VVVTVATAAVAFFVFFAFLSAADCFALGKTSPGVQLSARSALNRVPPPTEFGRVWKKAWSFSSLEKSGKKFFMVC